MLYKVILSCLILPLLFYTTYSDIKKSTISNKVLLVFLLVGLILNLFFGLNYYLPYIKTYLINALIVLALSILFYYFELVYPGDIKYIICLSFLTPLYIYEKYNFIFSIIYFLILSFSIGYIFLVLESLINRICNKEQFSYKKTSNTYVEMIVNCIENIAILTLVESVCAYYLGNKFNEFRLIVVIFSIILISIIKTNKEYFKHIVSIVSLLFLIIFRIKIYFSFYDLIFIIVYYAINEFISKYNYKTINISDLKENMILSSNSIMLLSLYNFENLPTDASERRSARLSKTNIAAINKFSKATNINALTIVRKIPFAIFISAGYLLFYIGGMVL